MKPMPPLPVLPAKMQLDLQSLKSWFLRERRDLPWRDNPSPYAVWVSEVMLQQTQVSVVIPYFLRWMQLFPTISSLAQADLDLVIKEWEGLGYYSRARNLHEGARFVVEHYNGTLPSQEGLLQKIKGLGPYTVGAILSFAFHQKKAAVDGNVMRVMARYFALADDISKPATFKKMQSLVQEFLPEVEPWIISEALIELGATICSRKPKCLACPLKQSCQAFLSGQAEHLPFKSAKIATTQLYRAVAVVSCGDHFLVKKGSKGKIMSDLYEFPYVECQNKEVDRNKVAEQMGESLGLSLCWQKSLPSVKHSFTRYRAELFPHRFSIEQQLSLQGYEWMSLADLNNLAFSSGHRRILSMLTAKP